MIPQTETIASVDQQGEGGRPREAGRSREDQYLIARTPDPVGGERPRVVATGTLPGTSQPSRPRRVHSPQSPAKCHPWNSRIGAACPPAAAHEAQPDFALPVVGNQQSRAARPGSGCARLKAGFARTVALSILAANVRSAHGNAHGSSSCNEKLPDAAGKPRSRKDRAPAALHLPEITEYECQNPRPPAVYPQMTLIKLQKGGFSADTRYASRSVCAMGQG